MSINNDYIYDTECFPNCFLLCAMEMVDGGNTYDFEISPWRNDLSKLRVFISRIKTSGSRMIGFNNLGFDYPVLHFILRGGISDAGAIYDFAMSIIEGDDAYKHQVWPNDRFVEQLDLYKIHHFDNNARRTSLKTLEFNMRLPNISDLPFPPGTMMTPGKITVLRDYCFDDVLATARFALASEKKIEFRESLSKQNGRDFMNHSDVKIGKEIFQMELEKAGIQCYEYGEFGRQPRQTKRAQIDLSDCVPRYIEFDDAGFEWVRAHFRHTTITETKGAFKDLTVKVSGLDYVFGTGGLHASVENEHFVTDKDYVIIDVDVTSMYPSIAIANRYYPEHLGPKFIEVYQKLKDQRLLHKKGTPENDMLKLALNGVYGASNDKFSIFFDPRFTMQITITGQLCLAMLAERLMRFGRIIQVNTDGITCIIPRRHEENFDAACSEWERRVGLTLEHTIYSKMFVADVNSYIAQKPDGTVKRKGRYEWDVEWHQDASALVVPKVAEKVLLEGADIRTTVTNWPDKMDFMLRAKANKGTKLVLDVFGADADLDRTQRYYVAKGGFPMVKIMPPLAKNPTEYRRIAVQKGYGVCACNNIAHATSRIDFDWYINEVEKLCLGVM